MFDVFLTFGSSLFHGQFLILVVNVDFGHRLGPLLHELAFHPVFVSALQNVFDEARVALLDGKLGLDGFQQLERAVELEVVGLNLKGFVDVFVADGLLDLLEQLNVTVHFLLLLLDGKRLLLVFQVFLVTDFHLASDLVVEDQEPFEVVFEVST